MKKVTKPITGKPPTIPASKTRPVTKGATA